MPGFDLSAYTAIHCSSSLPKGHPASARAAVFVKHLADEPFVLFHRAGAPELFDGIVGLCSRAGFTPRVVNEADLMQTVLDSGRGRRGRRARSSLCEQSAR
jgi:LysR substrate binding domain